MTNAHQHNLAADDSRRHGVVLLVTIIVLVILATLGYTLSSRVAARRHRDRYVVGYAQAQYGCASGLKYAMGLIPELEPELVSRPNEPDFSDVFVLTEMQYQDLLDEFADVVAATGAQVPGPYGPRWPLVLEPIEMEIGQAKVTIEIEDENAKYPLGWALMGTLPKSPSQLGSLRPTTPEEDHAAEASVGFQTFCEWMGYNQDEIAVLVEDLTEINKLRPFKLEYDAVTTAANAAPATSLTDRVQRTRGTGATGASAARAAAQRSVVSAAVQMDRQNKALSHFFHSSLLDTDLLTRRAVASDSRDESAMKYLGLWATHEVNVNSAPRHVLEAVLTFGSVADAPMMAQAIIDRRRIQPFSDLDQLKSSLLRYSDSIEKCKDFLTFSSTVFTVRVTANSGVARKVAVAGVIKNGTRINQVGMISD